MTAAELIALLTQLAQLSPAAVNLVKELISGLRGKSDEEVLAGDAQGWANIVLIAHVQQQPPPPTAVGPEPAKGT
jgi:hypothetical protein